MLYEDRDLYTVPVTPTEAIYRMCEGETLVMLSDTTPGGYLYIFHRYGMFNIVYPGKTTSQGTVLDDKDFTFCTFYRMEDQPTTPKTSLFDDDIVFHSNAGENFETFVFRLWDIAHKLDHPTSGEYSGPEGSYHLSDVKKTDDPTSIIKSSSLSNINQDNPLKGGTTMDHPRIIIDSKESESIETFIFRLHQTAKDLNQPVDGKFKFSYIGDVKPEDDPVNIIKAYHATLSFAMDQ